MGEMISAATEYQGHCPYCRQNYPIAGGDYNRHLEKCCLEVESYKHAQLREALKRLKTPWEQGAVQFTISRETSAQDSLALLQSLSPEQLRAEFRVDFTGEIVSDAGGAVKEWLVWVNSTLLSADFGLYRQTSTENVAYRFRACLPDSQLPFAWLHGLILAKALLEGVPLDCPLSLVLLKQLLGIKLNIEDLQQLNESLYKGLRFMHENDISGVFFQTFTVTEDPNITVELCPNGGEMVVSEENKDSYISLITEWELVSSTYPAFQALFAGFEAIIPTTLLQSMTPEELELAICGILTIDLKEWRANTDYKGEFHDSHAVVRWFWAALEEFSQEELALLLKFVMGTSRLPVEGFKGLRTLRGASARFTLEPVVYTDLRQFPRAHTCFNRLDLPLYISKHVLKDNLLYAVRYHNAGFGLD